MQSPYQPDFFSVALRKKGLWRIWHKREQLSLYSDGSAPQAAVVAVGVVVAGGCEMNEASPFHWRFSNAARTALISASCKL